MGERDPHADLRLEHLPVGLGRPSWLALTTAAVACLFVGGALGYGLHGTGGPSAVGASPLATPSEVPGTTLPGPSVVVACGSLTGISWTALGPSSASLTDAQVVQVDPGGQAILEVPGSPLRSAPPMELTGEELNLLVANFQAKSGRPLVYGAAAPPGVSVSIDGSFKPGFYVLYAGGDEVSAAFSARCIGSGALLAETLRFWSAAHEGILQCDLSGQDDAVARLARRFCPLITANAAGKAALALLGGESSGKVASTELSAYGYACPECGGDPSTIVWVVHLTGTFITATCGAMSGTPAPCPSPPTSALAWVDARTGDVLGAELPDPRIPEPSPIT